MSVSFTGRKTNPAARYGFDWVELTDEHGERFFNLANDNAVRFLRLLDIAIERADDLCGEMPIVDMIRKVQAANASFDYRVDGLVRDTVQGRLPGGPMIYAMGVGEDYFTRRLKEFSEFLADLSAAGADTISWG